MPFELALPAALRKARWKVKIREKECREPPHVTILRGTHAWRIDLRSGAFMDQQPDPSDVPEAIITFVKETVNWDLLCKEWDSKYPTNPVSGQLDTAEE